jgi:hypothetical protein
MANGALRFNEFSCTEIVSLVIFKNLVLKYI